MSDHLPVLMKMKVTQEIVSGIAGEKKALSAFRYSNPVQNEWSVSFNSAVSGSLKVKIFDAGGRLIREEDHLVLSGFNQFACDFTALKNGLYIVSLTTETNSPTVLKLVKN